MYRLIYIYTYINSRVSVCAVCPEPSRGDTDVLFKCSFRDGQYEAPSFLNPEQTLKSITLYSGNVSYFSAALFFNKRKFVEV